MTNGEELRVGMKYGPGFAAGWAAGHGRWTEALTLFVVGFIVIVAFAIYDAVENL